jgi:NAD(P)-dependent dehydrogenase (short-subunit alcohol dehydrogenase family)
LVTGSAKNLGRSIALDLAKHGARVAIHYDTSQKEAENTLRDIKEMSTGILVKTDVTNQKEVFAMVENVKKELGGIDILVNLVGDFIYEPITTTTFEKFKKTIESNLYSTFLCSQYALPSMVKKKWGRIINFGNVGAENLQIREKTTPYMIAKTGVIMLTKVMAYEYAKYGITINSISPGILKTSIIKPHTPTGKYAEYKDIINAVNFLLKDESSYINGANIEVTGGFRLGIS